MHEFKRYVLTINNHTQIYSACKKCGTIEVVNSSIEEQTCSGRMHKNSNVLLLNMKLLEVSNEQSN